MDQESWENDRMYEIFGRDREQGPVNGAEFLRDFLHPDFHDAYRDAYEGRSNMATRSALKV